MSAGDYTADGNAFLGDTELGRVRVALEGYEDRRGRQANGAIVFEISPDDKLLGRDITIIPDDGNGPFKVAVIEIGNGGFIVASQGDMPWWQ